MSRSIKNQAAARAERLRRKEARRQAAQALAHGIPGEHATDGNGVAENGVITPSPALTSAMVPAPRERRDDDYEKHGAFTIYKPGQGFNVRAGTAAALIILTLLFAGWMYDIAEDSLVWQIAGPAVALVVGGLLLNWVVLHNHRTVDFFIHTESELRKVNWSSRKEVIASTRIVIIAIFILAVYLGVVDLIFKGIFNQLGVLRFAAS